MQTTSIEKSRKFDVDRYKPQNHPITPNLTVFINSNDNEDFTVNHQPGLWKFYYERDETGKVDTKRPQILCVKKKNDSDPNSEVCNDSTRFEYDLDNFGNVTTNRLKKHHTTFDHKCGNWKKGDFVNKTVDTVGKFKIDPYLKRLADRD
jgi:hypothetical protein